MAEHMPFPGVKLLRADGFGDVYSGSADALIAAGLVTPEQLPGQPGNGSSMVSFYPDGTRVPRGSNYACKRPGYKQIRRVGKSGSFHVLVRQSEEEHERRDAERNAQWEREKFARAAASRQVAPLRRGHLRLVWSAPI
jgi:hypothetical protein